MFSWEGFSQGKAYFLIELIAWQVGGAFSLDWRFQSFDEAFAYSLILVFGFDEDLVDSGYRVFAFMEAAECDGVLGVIDWGCDDEFCVSY